RGAPPPPDRPPRPPHRGWRPGLRTRRRARAAQVPPRPRGRAGDGLSATRVPSGTRTSVRVMESDLQALVASGASLRELADQLGVSYATARRRLRDAGLQTVRATQRGSARDARAPGADDAELECPVHGPAIHRGGTR